MWPVQILRAYVRIAGGGIEIYDLIVVIRFADASAISEKKVVAMSSSV